MKKCYLCDASEEETFLYTGIHKDSGIVSVCRACYFRNKLPLVDKKEVNVEELGKRESVRDRLTRMAGVRKKEIEEPYRRHEIKPEDVGLKEVADKNARADLVSASNLSEDLVENFHWVIMRKRRAKKLSRDELASVIKVSPKVIEAVEQEAKLPKEYLPFVRKIENYLGVNLVKEKERRPRSEDILLESSVPSGMTIEDVKKKDEVLASDLDLEKIKEISGEVKEEEFPKQVKRKPLKDLSDEEIDKLIFGK